MRTYVIALTCLFATSAHANLPPNAWDVWEMAPYVATAVDECTQTTNRIEEILSVYRNTVATLTHKKPAINKLVFQVGVDKLPSLLKKAGFKKEAAELQGELKELERIRQSRCPGTTARQ